MRIKLLSILLVAALLCGMLSGCIKGEASDLMEQYKPNSVDTSCDMDAGAQAAADFGVRLFQQSVRNGENTLISPLSVLTALAMTANGADGETLRQMEEVLGADIPSLNRFLYTYLNGLPDGSKSRLCVANSIWIKNVDSFTVNPEFLQTNADYYNAGVYRALFDASTKNEINNWVKRNTDDMIKDIIDHIPEDAVMYLVNALAFEAEWEEIYKKHRILDRTFDVLDGDGTTRDVKMMYSEEGLYLEDENATGFIKYYANRNYAFVALLPREDLSLADYVAGLDGASLLSLLSAPQQITVNAGIPKFELEYTTQMSELLQNMGMMDAFDWTKADFSRLGQSTEGNLVINRVLHKTYINVDGRGTKAGAATAVEVATESAMEPEESRTVILDRPFVYLLIDCKTNLPFFMGTMADPEQREVTAASQNAENPPPVTPETIPETAPETLPESIPETIPEDDGSEPPNLTVSDGTHQTDALKSTLGWEFEGENGQRIVICGDGPHPLLMKELLNALITNEKTVTLSFSREPSSVSVMCWSDENWGNPEAVPEEVTVTGSSVTLKEGSYIYEVVAQWDAPPPASTGTVRHVFYVVSGSHTE